MKCLMKINCGFTSDSINLSNVYQNLNVITEIFWPVLDSADGDVLTCLPDLTYRFCLYFAFSVACSM